MGTFRFNRRIKTGPNTYMNIGKNGVSTSIRAGGMTFTSGKNGSYVTTGIPGTGMSYRQKIGGGSSNGQRSKKGNQYSGEAVIALLVLAGIFILLTLAKPTTIFMIILWIIGIVIGIIILMAIWEELVTVPQNKRLLAEALETEEAEVLEEINQTISSVESKMNQETDPLKVLAYEAFVKNYRFVRLYNLYDARKSRFEQRKDFNRKFVQQFYAANNEALAALTGPVIVDISEVLDKLVSLRYTTLSLQYSRLENSECEIDEKQYKPSSSEFFYLSVGVNKTPNFVIGGQNIFIYPTFIIKYNGKDDIEFISQETVRTTITTSSIRVANDNAPIGAKVINTSWDHMTKSGQPDARYSINKKYVSYTGSDIDIEPCGIHLYVANVNNASAFVDAMRSLQNALCGDTDKNEESEEIKLQRRKAYFKKLAQHIESDSKLLDILKFVCSQETIGTVALQKEFSMGYNASGRYIDLLESLAIISAVNGVLQRKVNWSVDVLNYALSHIQLSNQDSTNSISHTTPKAKSEKEDRKESQAKEVTHPASKTKNHQKELESLIGLESVKQEVNDLSSFIKIQQMRLSKGLKASPISYHCVFTGNPGTGKTTVARIIADIYKELGVLSKGHLIETDRSGLVAEYVGQTAVKTNKVIDSALDGVLFIDEAYSLAPASSNDFGHEAIATLLKRMEDNRDRLIVILAGYGDEMQTFIDANPGLQSRFNRYIHFPDYSADELVEIFLSNLKKNEYVLADDALDTLKKEINDAVSKKDKNFGNARTIRNIFERTLQNQARRISKSGDLSTESLQTITKEDIPDL